MNLTNERDDRNVNYFLHTHSVTLR